MPTAPPPDVEVHSVLCVHSASTLLFESEAHILPRALRQLRATGRGGTSALRPACANSWLRSTGRKKWRLSSAQSPRNARGLNFKS